MGSLIEFAKQEFLTVGYKPINECEDYPDKWIQENLLELLEVFEKQGHSGSSASYCIFAFERLAHFQPLTALKGTDDEWNAIGDDKFQNKRASNVFKENGVAYDINGYTFRDEKGVCYTGYQSARKVIFPYNPKTKCVDVKSYEVNKDTNEPEPGSGWWHTEYPQNIIDEREALKQEIFREGKEIK